MKSHGEDSVCENTLRKRDKSFVTYLQNKELVLESVWLLLPGTGARGEFTSDYSLSLAVVIQSNV